MLYRIAHIIRDGMPWLWDGLTAVLSLFFRLRYGRRLEKLSGYLQAGNPFYLNGEELRVERLSADNTTALAKMFSEQPEEAFAFFRPHGFLKEDLDKLAKDSGFLAFVVSCRGSVVGYFFQRSYFWGKSYRGYITDYRWRRRGVNTFMNVCATEISAILGLRAYGTISPENTASMSSAKKANDVEIVKTLANGDYLVEYLPKKVVP